MVYFRVKYWLLALILTNLYSQPVKAQSVTPATDGTETVINQTNNQINIQGGTLSADQVNLFHSFNKFGLNQNEIANFLSSPNIQNILGRVIGGNPSLINGLIQVTGGNSNLFLMNPSGIIFGANTQLNVPASFTATTATGIGFNNNFWFNATGVNNYAQLLGNPNQFAFNVNQPGSIFNAGTLEVRTGQNLSLIGGNMINTGNIIAPAGNINIVSVPDSSLVRISQLGNLLSLEINPSQTSAPSTITPLSLPQLLTGGNISEASGVTVNNNGEIILTSSGVVVPQRGITLNSSITTEGGNITLKANRDIITSDISTLGMKDGGEINILAGGDITTKNLYSSSYSVDTGNAGNGGNITLTTTKGSITTQDLSSVSVSSSGNTEKGGNIKLSATEGNITTGKIESNSSSIVAGNTKNAGDITLTTTGGNISTGNLQSASVSNAGNTENGGNIKLSTTGGNITTGKIESNSYSIVAGNTKNAGDITLTTTGGNISTANLQSASVSNAGNTENGGNIKLSTIGNITTGKIESYSYSFAGNTKNAGNITLTTTEGNISTTDIDSYSLSGNGGAIALETINGNILLQGSSINTFSSSTGGRVSFTGNVSLNQPLLTITTSSGNIIFNNDVNGTISGNNSLTLNPDAGKVQFLGKVGSLTPLNNLTINGIGMTEINGNVTTTNAQTYNNAVIANGDVILTGQEINFDKTVAGNGNLTLQPFTVDQNKGVLFNKTVNGNVNLNINSGSANVIFTEAVGNLQPLTSLNINSSGKTSLSNVTAATISTDAEGTTELNGNLTATAGNIQLNDPITLNNSTILTAKTSITTNTINGNYDLTLNAGSNITFNKDLGNTRDFLGNIIINQAVNVTGKNINAASINQFATGSINLGNMITNIGGVGLNSSNNITTGNITTSGQQISLTGTNISTGNINSSSPNVGGNIRILATNQIFTGNIDSSAKFGNGGNVTIDPITTIIDSINAQGGISGVGGNVEIRSHDTLRTTGTFIDRNGVLASISTAGGLGGGSIVIYHPGVLSFTVGNAGSHGTAGAITTGVSNSILPQILFSSTYTQNNISIISTDLRPDVQIFTPPKLDVKDTSVILNNNVDNILSDSNTNRQIVSNQLIAGNIKGAVSSIEQVLSGEYQGYYGEELQLDSQPQTVETIQAALRSILKQTGKRSAIFYMISQPKSLDLVIITPDGKPIHHNVKIDRQKLIADIRLFRNNVTDVKINGYKESGKTLYNSLVAPIEAALVTEKIDTLLLSVDNNLRSLPFSALYDGKNFLVEKYNIGLIPSVTLMDTGYKSLKNSQILLMGASKFTSPNQNPLPGVMVELPTVGREFGENRYFINQEFTIENLRKQRQQRPTQIVHLATHGEFNPGDSSQSYIQFWGEEKLQINQIRTLGLRNPPVELLVLSACRTALGNEQVELGFAGLAVQAGVKSALASLWYVSDEGTLGLMNEFYQKLKTAPIKSEALRQAQLAMIQGKVSIKNGELIGTRRGISLPPELLNIKNRNLSHPYYWSAFTMIGSPW